MSRLKRFAHSLLSGYMLLGVNVLFTLAAVPLALHYLSPDEFGLWAVTGQIATYIALLDFGLSGSAARIFIDYKDHPKRGEYGGVILTDVLVSLTQAGIIVVVGVGLAFVLGPLLHNIPLPLQPQFFWLVIGQACIMATSFAARVITHVLNANQRFDITNYHTALGFVLNYGIMWWRFARGDGVFSMLWGQAASLAVVVALNGIVCCRLKLFPKKGEWGRPTMAKFHEIFAFGRDITLYALGGQFVNASQTVLLTRLIGLDGASVWTVYTRTYNLLVQAISRIFDFSSSALAEMMVRGERELLLRRFRQIAILSVNLALAAGAVFAVSNSPFVYLWKAGKTFQTTWSPWNNLLLGVWLVVSTTVRVHTGLVGQSKALRFMRYIFFLEGLAFIGLTILMHRFGGITLMLTTSIVCSLCFTLPYGLRRTREYFNLSWMELARWLGSTLVLAGAVVPVCALVWWFTRTLPALQQLAIEWTVLGIWTGLMFLRYGLQGSLRTEVYRRMPSWAQSILARLDFAKSKD